MLSVSNSLRSIGEVGEAEASFVTPFGLDFDFLGQTFWVCGVLWCVYPDLREAPLVIVRALAIIIGVRARKGREYLVINDIV